MDIMVGDNNYMVGENARAIKVSKTEEILQAKSPLKKLEVQNKLVSFEIEENVYVPMIDYEKRPRDLINNNQSKPFIIDPTEKVKLMLWRI